jgi:Cdc6-like AAA superfamily ATPase
VELAHQPRYRDVVRSDDSTRNETDFELAIKKWQRIFLPRKRTEIFGAEVALDLDRTVRSLLSTEEFAPFAAYEGRLAVRLQGLGEQLRSDLSEEAKEVADAQALSDLWRDQYDLARGLTGVGLGALSLAVATASANFVGLWFSKWNFLKISMGQIGPMSPTVVSALAALGLAIVAVSIWAARKPLTRATRAGRAREAASDSLQSARNALTEGLRVRVAIALRLTIAEDLADEVYFLFNGRAPSMVEMDSAKVVPARTMTALADFIAQHVTSAIGVAGPRGIGKSTALRYLTRQSDRSLGVYISAPVRYEPTDFVRRVYEDVAKEVLGPTWERIDRTRAQVPVARLTTFTALVATGAICIYWAYNPTKLVGSFPTLAFAGLALLAVAFIVFMNEFFRIYSRQTAIRGLSPAKAGAARALESLRYRAEVGSTSKTAFKPLGGLLELGEDESVKLTAGELTRGELVSDLRRFLRDLYSEGRWDRIVIAIDELDKLDKPEDLIAVVNDMKDLLHIRGVHFVVSVSTDALDSFAARGVPSRDAFDSAFDSILMLGRMSPLESIEVLRGRSTGFPVPIALFCHAWSGGLPRDLLRVARSCIEYYADQNSGPRGTDEIVSHVLRRETEQAVEALLRMTSLRPSAPETVRTSLLKMQSIVSDGRYADALCKVSAAHRFFRAKDRNAIASLGLYLHAAELIHDAYGRKAVPVGEWHDLLEDGEALTFCRLLGEVKASISEPLRRLEREPRLVPRCGACVPGLAAAGVPSSCVLQEPGDYVT